jgi:hypothetical protein
MTTAVVRVAVLAVVAGLAGVVGGCSGGGGSGSTTPTTAAQAFDVCTLPADALVKAGVRPESVDKDTMLSSCTWTGSDYDLGAQGDTALTFDKIRHHPDNQNFVDVTVDGRPGLQWNSGTDADQECFVAFQVPPRGTVFFNVQKNPLSHDTRMPCDVLRDVVAPALVSPLPK